MWDSNSVFGYFFRLAGGLALTVSVAACTATSDYMVQPRVPVALVAPPNAALVVFLRPSGYGRSVATTILDDDGRFLGDSIGETQFAVALPPGKHVFLSWAENTAPLRAELLPGRVYYVEVSPRMGFWSTRVQLLALTPRSEHWEHVAEWLHDTTQLIPDGSAGQAYLNGRAEDVAERIRRAHERLTELDEEELAERTLLPQDGVASGPPMLVTVPNAPAPPPPTALPAPSK